MARNCYLRISQFIKRSYSNKLQNYHEAYRESIQNPELFWESAANELKWFKKWNKVCENFNSPFPKWFQGGHLNITYNCLDRHIIDGYGNQKAVIYDSPVTETKLHYTYSELLDLVSRMAGYLSRSCDVKKGDRVIIYMPMIPECLIAMLACARIGAIHAVVFGGFSAEQLAIRIKNSKPKVIITASYGVEPKKVLNYKNIVETALNKSNLQNEIKQCIFFNRPQLDQIDLANEPFYVDWNEALAKSSPHDAVPVESEHPLYLLYTSGTTGLPKGVVRDNGGYAVALKYSAEKIYDIQPGKVWWSCSEFGWVVGHSYSGYAPLLQRATTLIYEGKPVGTPDASQYFRVAQEYGVDGWFLTPSAIRAIRNEDCELKQSKDYLKNLSQLRNIMIAGEHCDPSTLLWFHNLLPPRVRLVDNWWQTETGWAITSGCLSYPQGCLNTQGIASPLGSAGRPVPGFNVQMVETVKDRSHEASSDKNTNEDSKQLKRILIKLPLPPGSFINLWENEQKFIELYFQKYPGFYDTMDMGYQDENGFIYVMSRADDVINVSGHRLSTSALEEACLTVKDIVDCVVVAVPHDVKGHLPFGIFVKNKNSQLTEQEIKAAAFKSVREIIGPVASFSLACIVPKLPKTRSGKIPRGSLTNMASGKPVQVPVTIEDITAYIPIYEEFKKHGLNPSNISQSAKI